MLKINPSLNSSNLKMPLNERIAKKFASSGEMGEGVSIACDFLGKAVLVPAVIMASSSEPKEKKEYSALKNPVAASIQLMMEVPILAAGGKIVANAANKGFFDKEGSNFSYNEKACRQKFIDCFEKYKNQIKDGDIFIQNIKTNGYSADLAETLSAITENIDKEARSKLDELFKNFESAHKNQFHLKNRICFVAALLLTPVLCALENKFHPIIMDKIYKHRNKNANSKELGFDVNIDNFIQKTKGGML